MPAWIARRAWSREFKEQRLYVCTDRNQLRHWSSEHDCAKVLSEEASDISNRRVRAVVQRKLQAEEVARADLDTGQYYPRIWRRGRYTWANFGEDCTDHDIVLGIQAAELLLERMRDVFRTIQPCKANRHSFGHEIRALLLLACTEVESAWKAVLRVNGYAGRAGAKGFLTTKDYVKLRRPLRLREWVVRMPLFPDYGEVAPFRSWKASDPTDSLRWYGAYNAAKHDREGSFSMASLERVIEAVAAVFVMVAAQAGPPILSEGAYSIREFVIARQPSWRLAEEYVPPFEFSQGKGARSLPTWTPTNYPFR